MKKSIKAALFSALVFPGVGHFSLGRYPRGLVFFLPALLSLLYLLRNALDRAYTIADQIQQGTIPLDAEVITNLITAPPTDSVMLLLNIATWTIILSWLIALVDAFLLGKKIDQAESQ